MLKKKITKKSSKVHKVRAVSGVLEEGHFVWVGRVCLCFYKAHSPLLDCKQLLA